MKNGFTLIELLIYISLTSIVIGGTIKFAWDVIYSRVKTSVYQEVSSNLRLAGKRITYEVRNASAVNSVTANDICLASTDSARNPTRIYLSNGRLRIGWGGGLGNCTSLANDYPLTSNLVNLTNLSFENVSTADGKSVNIKYSLTIEGPTAASRKEWEATQTYTSSVELRSN